MGDGMKTVLITGASRGLGREFAIAFAALGCNLILHARDQERLQEVAKLTVEASGRIEAEIVTGDLEDPATLNALAEAAGRVEELTAVIFNAGMYSKEPIDVTDSKARRILAVNLLVPVILTRMLYPLLKEQQSGTLVYIGSVAAFEPSEGETAYAASKAGLMAFAKALRWEAVHDGLQVLAVTVGAMRTDMTSGRPDFDKLIDPEEVADTVAGLVLTPHRSVRIDTLDFRRTRY
jgi:short-subunit dehydrogenase